MNKWIEIGFRVLSAVTQVLSARKRPKIVSSEAHDKAREVLIGKSTPAKEYKMPLPEMPEMPEIVEVPVKPAPSPRLAVNTEDLRKVGKGALLAAAGAAVAFMIDALPGIDLGPYTAIIAPLASIVLNFIRKWLAGPARQ